MNEWVYYYYIQEGEKLIDSKYEEKKEIEFPKINKTDFLNKIKWCFIWLYLVCNYFRIYFDIFPRIGYDSIFHT